MAFQEIMKNRKNTTNTNRYIKYNKNNVRIASTNENENWENVQPASKSSLEIPSSVYQNKNCYKSHCLVRMSSTENCITMGVVWSLVLSSWNSHAIKLDHFHKFRGENSIPICRCFHLEMLDMDMQVPSRASFQSLLFVRSPPRFSNKSAGWGTFSNKSDYRNILPETNILATRNWMLEDYIVSFWGV